MNLNSLAQYEKGPSDFHDNRTADRTAYLLIKREFIVKHGILLHGLLKSFIPFAICVLNSL